MGQDEYNELNRAMKMATGATKREGGCHKVTMRFIYHTGPLAGDRPTIHIQQYSKFTPLGSVHQGGHKNGQATGQAEQSLRWSVDKLIYTLNHAHNSL